MQMKPPVFAFMQNFLLLHLFKIVTYKLINLLTINLFPKPQTSNPKPLNPHVLHRTRKHQSCL